MSENLMTDFVWKNTSENLRQEVVEMWLREGAIESEQIAEERARELVAVCRNESKELIGVSTHSRYFDASLKNDFHLSRTYIIKDYRNLGAMKNMFQTVWANFNEKKVFIEEGIVGIIAVMQNPLLNKRTDAIWYDLANATLLGFDKHGFQIRIAYFPEAHVTLPRQIQSK